MKKNKIATTLGRVCALWVFLASASAATQARDNSLERARHHMELGQQAFEKGSFEEAANQFVNAFVASPFSAFLYNAGLAWERAQVNEKAVEFYRRYLDAEPKAPDFVQVEIKIQALLPGVETPAAPTVEITEVAMKSLISIRTNPANAEVRILDGAGSVVASANGPAAQTVVGGTYTVEASHPDFRTVQTKISVSPGEVYVVVVEMSQGAFLGFLHIETDVPGADVYIGDRSHGKMGTTPWGNVLPAGEHKIWVEKPGYLPAERTVAISLGAKAELQLELERLPFGMLLVKTNVPGAQVFLGDVSLGPAPLEKRVSVGRHRLRVVADGMKDYSEQIVVAGGQLTKALVRMNPTPSRTSAWVSLGFSAAFFAGGGVAGIVALRLNNQLDDARNKGRLASDDPRILKGFMWGLGADLAFGVGTVVGALCLYYFLRDTLPPSEGKLFSPVDINENPDNIGNLVRVKGSTGGASAESGAPSGKNAEKHPAGKGVSVEGEEPAQPVQTEDDLPLPVEVEGENPRTGKWKKSPRLMFAPVLTTRAAGLGIVVVF